MKRLLLAMMLLAALPATANAQAGGPWHIFTNTETQLHRDREIGIGLCDAKHLPWLNNILNTYANFPYAIGSVESTTTVTPWLFDLYHIEITYYVTVLWMDPENPSPDPPIGEDD